ncbi:MAG: hypothetical protein ABJB74_04385, partial [Gemmatimonas sp.]
MTYTFRSGAFASASFAIALLASSATVHAQTQFPAAKPPGGLTNTSRAVTYTKDVAPIIQQNCQQCHQPGSIAPINLMTYEDAKKYSNRIKTKVSQRLMPPWHIDRTVG